MTNEMVVWGFYTEPVVGQQLVHNLEHGGIVFRGAHRYKGPERMGRETLEPGQ